MTIDLTHILVFRTNINTESDKALIRACFSKQAQLEDWSVDMEDIDRVLRVVSHELCAADIIRLINGSGYQCQEL